MRIGIALLALAAMPSFAAAPLFDADDTVSFTLVAPFARMLKEKPGDYRDAEVIWTDANGKEVHIPARVKGRGFSRMKKDICQFPPLLLEVAADKTPDTPFEGETLLPLSTHCTRLGTSNSKATSRLWLEYLVYRAFNAVSDSSFLARPLEITYVDADSAKRKATHPAFVIESFDGIAARLNGSVYRAPAAERTNLDAAQATRVEVFEYFAGNTDFSLIRGPEGEPCCHNVLLLQRAARLLPIPYDFDSTGMVDPPYAQPAPKLGIRSVRTRLYRGSCRPDAELTAALDEFRSARETLYALFRDDTRIGKGDRAKAVEYLDEFFETIDDPKRVQRDLIARCT
jgi:hypothetical protein